MRLVIPIKIEVPLYGEAQVAASAQSFERAWETGRVQDAIRRVLAKEALQYYRELVLAAMPDILEPELANQSRPELLPGTKTLRKTLEARDKAIADGASATEVAKLDERLKKSLEYMAKEIANKSTGDMATGKFRERANKVLAILTDPEQIALWRDAKGVVHWGVGRLSVLKAAGLRVPSYATYKKKGRRRAYPNALMWKQIEYGAGAYSTGSKRSADGWQFGGLSLVGVRGTGGFKKVLKRVNSPAVQQQLIAQIIQVVTNG